MEKATDIITTKAMVKNYFLTYPEFKKIDLRRRKKPVGEYRGLCVWIDNKAKPDSCYIIDRTNFHVYDNTLESDFWKNYTKVLFAPTPKGTHKIWDIC